MTRRVTNTRRLFRTAVAISAATALAVVAVPAPSSATPLDDPSSDPFYQQVPSDLGALPHGRLLRSRDVAAQITPGVPFDARATQIVYTSRDLRGRPDIVSGTVFVPNAPWTGAGARPVVSWGPGTQGIGDTCASSYQLATGSNYEAGSIAATLAHGETVVVTDYEGQGTPGDHTYAVGLTEGKAMLDAVLAAQQLPGDDVRHDAPVGLVGYSQGGAAAAFAAQLQADYAGHLRLAGTVVGDAPSDLYGALVNVDGGVFSFLLPYALTGLNAAIPELRLDSYLTPAGQVAISDARSHCLFQMFGEHAFQASATLTTGTPVLQRPEWRLALALSRVGFGELTAPAFIYQGSADTVVPEAQAHQLLSDWCRRTDKSVELQVIPGTDHFTAFYAGLPGALGWLDQRFAGAPATTGCPPNPQH